MNGYDYGPAEYEVVALEGAAASAGITHRFPGADRFALRAVSFKLVAGGGVANRRALVSLLGPDGVPVAIVAAPGLQTAGLTVVYSFAAGVLPFGDAAGGYMGGPLPSARLPENLSVAVSVVAAAAGDTLSDARLLVCQWPSGGPDS